MNNTNSDFDTWFDNLCTIVHCNTEIIFRDRDSVLQDFEAGKDCEDVADEIIQEYND